MSSNIEPAAEGWAAPAGAGLTRSERKAQGKAAKREAERNIAQIKQWAKDTMPAHKLGLWGSTVLIWEDRIANKSTGEIYPLDGVSVEFETDAAVTQRITMSRAVTGVGLFLPKQVDKGASYITVTGPKFSWTLSMGTGALNRNTARKAAVKADSYVKSHATDITS